MKGIHPVPSPSELQHLATGRPRGLFQDDLEGAEPDLKSALKGRRVLVIGGAGTIGAATVRVLSRFAPAAVHVVDRNENSLAELTRTLRGEPQGKWVEQLRALPLDMGSPVFLRFIQTQPPYDFVLNFAALKHVRSEKDVPSTLQLLDTNVVAMRRLMRWLEQHGAPDRYFSVSTDKAADPVNIMGASKRIMEHVMFLEERSGGLRSRVSSARFANVAFSDGSLLFAFLRRFEKGQPLAVPANTKRYFVSIEESGVLCALAAILAPGGHIAIPALVPSEHLVDLVEVALRTVEGLGFEAVLYEDEDQAKAAVGYERKRGRWPVLVTPRDTTGEKEVEVFSSDEEDVVDIGFRKIKGILYELADPSAVEEVVDRLEWLIQHPDEPITKPGIVALLARIVPTFEHRDTGKILDERL